MIDSDRSAATAAMHVDFSPPQPVNELTMLQHVPNMPTNGAVAATVARPRKPRAIRRCTNIAERSAAYCAEAMRQAGAEPPTSRVNLLPSPLRSVLRLDLQEPLIAAIRDEINRFGRCGLTGK